MASVRDVARFLTKHVDGKVTLDKTVVGEYLGEMKGEVPWECYNVRL